MEGAFAIVCNPASRNGAVGRQLPRVEGLLRQRGVDYRVYQTTKPRDAHNLVRSALDDGYQTIVAMGGDGTFHEVANGIIGPDGKAFNDARLGLLPCGSGNDFPRSFGFPRGIEAAVNLLLAGQTRRVDVGRATCEHDGTRQDHIFLSVAGAGVTSRINEIASGPIKKIGSLRYAIAGPVGLLGSPVRLTDVRLDDLTLSGPYAFVCVCNTGFFGSGMPIASKADPTDGRLDVVLCETASRLRLVTSFPTIFFDAHWRLPEISLRQGRRIEIPHPQGSVLVADGEVYYGTPVVYEVLPEAVDLIVPAAKA